MNKIVTVVERHELHVFWQVIVLDLLNLRFEITGDLLGILSFVHHDNAFHDIILIASANLAEAGLAALMHCGKIAHEDRGTVDVLHDDIADLMDVVDEAYAADHVGLRTTLDDIASYVHITSARGLIAMIFLLMFYCALSVTRLISTVKCRVLNASS